jgi:ribose-phosphate pyrophosphokinase
LQLPISVPVSYNRAALYGPLKIFSGRAHPVLTREICALLGIEPGRVSLYSFADGENYVQIDENVRGADVFIMQPTSPPANDNLMELLIMLDAFKRSSARRVTAVMPYYGYARQDRKDKPRVPITSKLVADLITAAGADRVLTLDLHAAQIQGFFNIPVDHLFAAPVIVKYLKTLELADLTIVSPDAGGVERARAYAKRIGAALAIIDKRRIAANQTEVMHIIGEVEGRNVFIVDDIIDTAGTLIHSVDALFAKGARSISACCTHAVLSGPAIARINNSPLNQVVCTNSMATADKEQECSKLKALSIAELFAEAIKRIHNEDSVSSLFEM